MKVNNSTLELLEISNSVLSQYNITPKEIEIIQNDGLKTLWKFSFKNQIMCLKRLRHTKEKATFTVNAQIYIQKNGGKVPKVFLNTSKEPITEYMGQLFVLYEWINGRDLNFTRHEDFIYGIEALADFHTVSKGYKPPEDAKISFKLGKWINQYTSMRNRMTKWKDIAKTNPSNPSYKSYLEHIDSIIELCNKAIDTLENSSYKEITSTELHQSTMCHQDYGSGNALLSPKGVYVIDLDGVTYDLPARDLRKIIGKRAEKRGYWDKSDITEILSHYEKNNKLSNVQKEMLMIDLMFPHWFFGTVKNIFSKNKNVNPSKISKAAKLETSKMTVI